MLNLNIINNIIYSEKDNNSINEEINQMENMIDSIQKNYEDTQLSKVPTIQHNFFNENKQLLLNNINKKENSKKKTFSKTKGLNPENKFGQMETLFKEAFNPFDLNKVLKLQTLYPRAFCKK